MENRAELSAAKAVETLSILTDSTRAKHCRIWFVYWSTTRHRPWKMLCVRPGETRRKDAINVPAGRSCRKPVRLLRDKARKFIVECRLEIADMPRIRAKICRQGSGVGPDDDP